LHDTSIAILALPCNRALSMNLDSMKRVVGFMVFSATFNNISVITWR